MSRVTDAEALALLRDADLHELGRRAHAERMRHHDEEVVTYIVDRNINYSDACTVGCRFCAFHRCPNDARSHVLSQSEVFAKIDELLALGGRSVLWQGGVDPSLDMAWHTSMLRAIKRHAPSVYVHGYSPPEIADLAARSSMRVEEVLRRLIDAGLESMPGGGAEILVDEVRRRVSPRKCDVAAWLGVMRAAHRLGITTTATMMFGHVETLADRVAHWRAIRELQDETGGFTAFIAWPFQPGGTALSREVTQKASVQDYLRTLAVARVYLDGVANVQASWVTMGPSVAQAALRFGANDFGSLMIEENVVASAGTRFSISESELRGAIADAGFVPMRRDYRYRRECGDDC